MKPRFGILSHLLGSFEVHLVHRVFIEFTVVGGIISTNLRSCMVNATAMIALKMLASRMNQQVPNLVFDEYARSIVQQVPTHKIKILLTGRFVNRKCKVSATLGSTVIAQALARWDLLPFWRFPVNGFGWQQNWIYNATCHGALVETIYLAGINDDGYEFA
jgi:hypothetical protein